MKTFNNAECWKRDIKDAEFFIFVSVNLKSFRDCPTIFNIVQTFDMAHVISVKDVDEFPEDEVKQIVYESIEKILGGAKFLKFGKLKNWTDLVSREVSEELSKLEKAFKYIVTCSINQRDGAGLHTHSSCWFNNDTFSISTPCLTINLVRNVIQ